MHVHVHVHVHDYCHAYTLYVACVSLYSPVIIADDADVDIAAKRIVWGKFLNSGQTCIAPDYVLCSPDKQEKLVQCCKKVIQDYYGEDPKSSKDYGRIINDRHFQ